VAPITYENRVPSLIPIATAGAMNEQRTGRAIRVLERIVAMIPGMSILGSSEVVCVSLTSGDRALRYAIYSIGLIRVELTDTVPVDGAPVSREKVGHVNGDVVTPASFNQRAGVSAIDHFPRSLEVSIRRDSCVGYINEIFPVDTFRP